MQIYSFFFMTYKHNANLFEKISPRHNVTHVTHNFHTSTIYESVGGR